MIKKKFIAICIVAISSLLYYCDKKDNSETIITNIDMEEMAHKLLPDFNLLRERAFDSLCTEFVFKRENDGVNVFIIVGLYQSDKDAVKKAKVYLNDISIMMTEVTHQGVTIGDKYWWWENGSESNSLINIVFLRKNALFILSCSQSYSELENFAKKIDTDILNEESYISFLNR